jgi:hypothetical protein
MIRPPRFIDVLPEDIDPKEEYQGYKKGEHSYSLCSITFDENLNPIKFDEYPLTDEEKEGITAYMRHMTWQEEKEWYENCIDFSNGIHKINLIGLHTDLYSVGDGCHEMWNGWLGVDWREQLMNLLDEGFSAGAYVDVVCSININEFRGNKTVQLIVRDIDYAEKTLCDIELQENDFLKLQKDELFYDHHNIPKRQDFAMIYKFLRDEGFRKEKRITLMKLKSAFPEMSYLKLLIILETFSESDLIKWTKASVGTYRIQQLEAKEKKDLYASPIMRMLMQN